MSRHHPHRLHRSATPPKSGLVDYIVTFFMFLSPLFEIPQAINIYTLKSSDTVSLATWSLFFVASVAWLVYGIRHHLRSIIAIQVIYMVVEATVVVGILMYP
jgi:uncharacterized protein with PQ loop repeat